MIDFNKMIFKIRQFLAPSGWLGMQVKLPWFKMDSALLVIANALVFHAVVVAAALTATMVAGLIMVPVGEWGFFTLVLIGVTTPGTVIWLRNDPWVDKMLKTLSFAPKAPPPIVLGVSILCAGLLEAIGLWWALSASGLLREHVYTASYGGRGFQGALCLFIALISLAMAILIPTKLSVSTKAQSQSQSPSQAPSRLAPSKPKLSGLSRLVIMIVLGVVAVPFLYFIFQVMAPLQILKSWMS